MKQSVYRRPDKPMYKPVKQRDMRVPVIQPLQLSNVAAVDAVTECHVTPLEVGARMVSYADPFYGDVLEPQAGTGNLVQCLTEAGVPSSRITAVERHVGLSSNLDKRFDGAVKVHNDCFLEYAALQTRKFKHIVMNPPFKHGSSRRHVLAALSLLDDCENSSLVALVPVSFSLDGFEDVEILPKDTFAYANVYTKIVMYTR